MISKKFSQKIVFDFDEQIDSQENLEGLVSNAYQKNTEFFNQDKVEVKINFVYERSEMDEACGYKTPVWAVAAAKDKQIFIFSPNVIEKVSHHPKSDFEYTLTHEIAHLFTDQILKFNYPKWLKEGLAGYVAQQYKIRKVKKIHDFANLHDKKGWVKFPNYPQAYFFVKYLFEKFGQKKMMSFLEKISPKIGPRSSYEEFTKFFNLFFKKDFNQETSLWSKSFKAE